MTTRTCDLCGQELTRNTSVTIGGLWQGTELCAGCARPVVDFLVEHDLLGKARLEHLRTNEKTEVAP